MTSKIAKATAYTNGEVAYIAWKLKGMIPGCLGFEITRIYPDEPANNTVLPAWVAFKGQKNTNWDPQNTSVWPIQKLSWKDLTLRKYRDQVGRHPDKVYVQYKIRPVVAYKAGLDEVKSPLPVSYTGQPVRLSYLDEGVLTDKIFIDTQYGDIRATFTNGILATQWLSHTLRAAGANGNIKKLIAKKDDPVRTYLAGDALETLSMLLIKAKNDSKVTLRMALYELDDDELLESIKKVNHRVDLVLSNTSKNTNGDWDVENAPARADLKNAGVKVTDRMFNNNSIGHNKFIICLVNDKPTSVMTGSTNWTPNGLCAQSNNAVIIDSPDVAKLYSDYFDQMKEDTKEFTVPDPLSEATHNVQGADLRNMDMKSNDPVTLPDGTKVTVWFSPNTKTVSVNKKKTPPDLSAVYSHMRKAEKAIFFAVFLPGASNNRSEDNDIMTNIITEAISLGGKDSSLLVYGAISDPMAMPNYVKGEKPVPTTYDEGSVHIVRASSIPEDDIIGDFEREILSAGHAIIHDKIVVIDPFSDHGVVVFGSHNLGFKASYGNDENLLIVENNPALAQAYAVHVLDIYEHYRFRAVQQELRDQGKRQWDGYLSLDDHWLTAALGSGGKGDLAEYMVG